MEKEDGYALVNHILKNISLPVGMHTYSNCKNRCMMEDRCKSIRCKSIMLCQVGSKERKCGKKGDKKLRISLNK